MMISHLFKYLKIDISGETVFASSTDIDCTLLKRMQAGARAYIPQAPPPQFASGSSSSGDPFPALTDKMNSLELSSSSLRKNSYKSRRIS